MASANKQPNAPRWLAVGLVVLLGFGMLQCSLPTDVGAPRWDVPFTLAFNTQRYGLADLVLTDAEFAEDSAGIRLGEDDELVFVSLSDLDPFSIGEADLTSDNNTSITYETPTDTLVLGIDQQLEETVLLEDMLSDFGIPSSSWSDGDPIQLAPGGGDWDFPTTRSEITFDDLQDINYARIVDGELELTITNDTNIEFSDMSVTLRREEIDGNGYVDLTSFDFGSIAANSSETQTYAFDSDILTASLRIVIDGGGPEQVFTAFHDDELRFGISVGTLRADFAEAIIQNQDPETTSDAVVIDEDIWIKEGVVTSGSLDWTVENEMDVNSDITLTFPQVYPDGGADPFSITFSLERRRTGDPPRLQSGSVDLAGYEIRFADDEFPDTPGETQTMETVTTVNIQQTGSAGDYARVSVGDSVLTTFQVNNISFSSISGVPRDLNYEIASETQNIEFWQDEPDVQVDFGNNISLADVDLVLELANQFQLPLEITVNILAENTRAGLSETRTVVRTLQGAEQTLRINDLQNIVNIAPNAITISGTARTGYEQFGVPPSPYALEVGDTLSGVFRLDAPLKLSMPNETPLRPLPVEFEDEVEADIKNFLLASIVENRVPLGGKLYIIGGVFPDSLTAREELKLVNADQYLLTVDDASLPTPLIVPAAPSDADGRATGVAMDTVFAQIPENKIDLFSQPGMWTRQLLVLDATPAGQDIIAHSTDYIDVTLVGEITYTVNAEDEE